ncbi:hypothetical protein FRC09_016560 [Ceratobasidium sp. 395]|nr:hypothetical protein FRC09_016560 [Ceratobasidium sp. 395]
MATTTFLEFYAISTICECLHRFVFDPFYPIHINNPNDSVQFNAFAEAYNALRVRDPQILSAKWRVDAYSALFVLDHSRDSYASTLGSNIASQIDDIGLCLFGIKPKSTDLIVKLVERAMKLNHKLKAEVVHEGDFHVEYASYNAAYNASTMDIMDHRVGNPEPTCIVSTCGLGVRLTKAVGGGKQPESTVILNTLVADEKAIYD